MTGVDRVGPADEGGETAFWLHLVGDERPDITDRFDIETLVRNFYRDAAMDDLLGPVFEAAHVHWDAHVATLIDFWAWQLLGQPGYDGHPLRAHEPVHARTPLSHAHYERWVELFTETVDASFTGKRADAAKVRGRKMAAAMERLLAGVSASGTTPIAPIWRDTSSVRNGSGVAPVHDDIRSAGTAGAADSSVSGQPTSIGSGDGSTGSPTFDKPAFFVALESRK